MLVSQWRLVRTPQRTLPTIAVSTPAHLSRVHSAAIFYESLLEAFCLPCVPDKHPGDPARPPLPSLTPAFRETGHEWLQQRQRWKFEKPRAGAGRERGHNDSQQRTTLPNPKQNQVNVPFGELPSLPFARSGIQEPGSGAVKSTDLWTARLGLLHCAKIYLRKRNDKKKNALYT